MTIRNNLLAALVVVGLASPAMAADQCGGDFGTWLSALHSEAAAQGVGQRGLSALDHAHIDSRVIASDRAQGVFTQSFIEFSTRMESGYRLSKGKVNLKKYAAVFDHAKKTYGVPGAVIAAFWALETDFGAVQGNFHTLDALATLSHDCRRPQVFRPQLVALLKLFDRGVVPVDVEGAWAGEIGQTQMLPADYLADGVDGDGDGRVDLRHSAPDVIMTTANFLHTLGWKAGQPWLEEVEVPDQMPWEQTGRENRETMAQWAALGVKARGGGPLDDTTSPASLVLPMGRKGPAFLAFDNYDVYLKWNHSFVYTLTAANLATRFDGAPPYLHNNPTPPLSPSQMKALQQKLQAHGHDVGKIDGVLGMATREGIRAEQKRLGMPEDGWPTPALLAAL